MDDIRRMNLTEQLEPGRPTDDSKRDRQVAAISGRSLRDERNVNRPATVNFGPLADLSGEVHCHCLNSSHQRRPVVGVDQQVQRGASIEFQQLAAELNQEV